MAFEKQKRPMSELLYAWTPQLLKCIVRARASTNEFGDRELRCPRRSRAKTRPAISNYLMVDHLLGPDLCFTSSHRCTPVQLGHNCPIKRSPWGFSHGPMPAQVDRFYGIPQGNSFTWHVMMHKNYCVLY